MKPLLEAPGVLKVGQNVKFDLHVFAQRGVELAPIDDTMLISYALDAGATADGHGMDALSERWLGHKPIAFTEVAGSGRNFIGFARVAIDKARRIRRRGRRRDAAPVARAEAAPRRRGHDDGL